MIEFDLMQTAELPQVEALYAAAGYGGGVAADDAVLVARRDGQLVAVVRLCPEEGVTVLRGMQVSSALQRQGIGAQLLAACIPHMDHASTYCLPYSHLAQFYGAAGFEILPADTLPRFLAIRLASYLAKGQDVIAMRRLPGQARV